MSFERIESFDYSTENMDNESIQDKIDAKTLEISQLTKESLKELKVDIQNENSSLTLRDNDGNYLGKVRDNEVLIYEGEAKPVEYKGSQKLFLKVRTKTGKVGFVSADYLKAKVNQDKIHVQKAANDWEIKAPVAPIKQEKAKKETNSKKEEKSTTIEWIQEKNNQQQTKEVSWEKNKELETADKNKTNNIETLSNITVWGLDAYSKADKFSWLDIWNNVEVSREMVNFQQNIESLQNYHEKINNPHIQLLLTVLPIWTDAARQKAQEQWSIGGLIDDKEKILAYIDSIESKFNTLINTQWEIDYKNEINNIFSDILKAENDEEDIIDNIEDVQKILLNTSEKSVEDDKATILKLMAGSFATDGNTKKVLEFTRNEIIKNSPEIKEKIEQILNIESFESIDAQYFINLWLNSEQAKDLVSDLEEKRTEIHSYSTKQRELFKTEILKHQPELSGQDLTDRIDDAINASVHMRLRDLSIQWVANNLIHNSQSNDSFTTLYKDLDSFSQSASEWLGDNLAMIVVSLIPMWAAFTAVWLAGKAWRAAYLWLQASKFTKIQTVWNIVGHTWKAATFGRNMAKWAIFYEALNATNNGLYLDKNQDLTEMFNGWDDASEVLKMSLTFGIFGMLQKSLKIIPEWQTLKSTANKELFKRGITALSAEWAAFSGIEVWIDFTQGELKTWEEYIEVFASWVLMWAAFRWVEAMPKKQSKVSATVIGEYTYKIWEGNVKLKKLSNWNFRDSEWNIYQKTWENAYKNLNNGQSFEIKPENLTQTSSRQYNIDHEWKPVNSERLLNTQEKLLKSELKKYFNNKENTSYKIGEWDEAIKITRDGSNKFYIWEKEWAIPKSLNKIVREINEAHSEKVMNLLKTKVDKKIKDKSPDSKLTIKWWEERITKDGTIQKKDGKEWRNATKDEINVIMSDPEKAYKILSSKLDEADITNHFSKEWREWLSKNWGTKWLLKEIFLSRTNILSTTAFVGWDFFFDREADLWERVSWLILALAGWLAVWVTIKSVKFFAWWGMSIAYNWAAQYAKPMTKFLGNYWWKLAWAWVWWLLLYDWATDEWNTPH